MRLSDPVLGPVASVPISRIGLAGVSNRSLPSEIGKRENEIKVCFFNGYS
jgi:hypothetical protein